MTISTLGTPTLYREDKSGKTYLYTVPIASASLIPTRPEMALSTTYDCTTAVASKSGWETGRDVSTANIRGGDLLPVQVDGFRTAGSPMMEFWADKNGADVRDILTEGAAIDVQHLPAGDVPTAKTVVYRTTVRNITDLFVDGDIDRIRVEFNMVKDNERVTIPA